MRPADTEPSDTAVSRGPDPSHTHAQALRRNWGTATVLVLFVALSAMLASSAGALITTVTGATASLMQQARTPHFLQMHAGELDEARLASFVAGNPLVEEYAAVAMLNVDGAAIRLSGPTTDTNLAAGLQDNSFVTQGLAFDFLLDTNGQVIEPEPGTVWLPLYYQESLGLAVGNTLSVTDPGATASLRVAGFLRDSQMNSSYASSKMLVSAADKAALAATVGAAGSVEYLIQFRLTDASVAGAFESQYRDAGLESNGPTLTWSLFVLVNSLSEGITAAIVSLVTLLLVGLVASLGLSWLLLRHVELYMGPAGRALPSLLIGVALSALIVGIVAAAVRSTLRRVDLVSPVQAIRSGAPAAKTTPTGAGRQGAARWPSVIADSPGTNLRLGLRDLLRRRSLYVVPLAIFTLASFILIVPQNLYTTVTQPDFITYMGAGVSDMRIDVQASADAERVAELSAALAQDPQVA